MVEDAAGPVTRPVTPSQVDSKPRVLPALLSSTCPEPQKPVSCTDWLGLRGDSTQRCWDLRGPGSGPTKRPFAFFLRELAPQGWEGAVLPPNAWAGGRAWGPPGAGGIAELGPQLGSQYTEVLAEARAWGWAEGPGGCS